MEEWKEYKLGNVCEVLNGRAYKQEELLSKGKYPVLRVGNIFQGNNWYYSDLELPENKYCNKGDLLYAWSCGFAPYIWEGDKTIYHYHIWKLIENKEILDRKFLYYYLIINTKRFVGGIHGSVMVHLTKKDMENQVLKVPSLPTQQKIANILSSLDDKIEVNCRINEQLEELAQALFKSWFVDFEPFKDGEFVESELGMIPEGWKVGTLGNVADVVMGASPAGSSYNTEGNGSIFYQGRTDFGFRFPNVRMYTTEPKRFAESNSVLLSVRAPVGDVNIAFEKCCIGRGLASIKSNSNADSYTYYLMKSLKPVLDNYNNEGTVFGCINKDALNNLSIVVPTIEIIKEFERIVSCSDMEIRRRSEEITHLTNLRDTLLPKLMSGEIDVNDVEI